jgi:hypothetical protein
LGKRERILLACLV